MELSYTHRRLLLRTQVEISAGLNSMNIVMSSPAKTAAIVPTVAVVEEQD